MDGASVMILDELDSGVGSRLGSSVGQLLRRMSAASGTGAAAQIICVSHLPQVLNPLHVLSYVCVLSTSDWQVLLPELLPVCFLTLPQMLVRWGSLRPDLCWRWGVSVK